MADPRAIAEGILLKVLEVDPDQDYGRAVTRATNLAYTHLIKAGESKASAERVANYVLKVGAELGADLLRTVHPEITNLPTE
ncbi:hypothetical protein ACWFMI_23740 [Nocardiopsis terrae]|uniref:hypothetical protein n=1 Tax=Streptomyces sp. NPDC057554 TaxID=3350538 RepID=UPI00369A8CC1